MRRLKSGVLAAVGEKSLAGRRLNSSDELLSFLPPDCADDPEFEEDRSRLFFAAQQGYDEATLLFEAV
jgi:hypothetical protein